MRDAVVLDDLGKARAVILDGRIYLTRSVFVALRQEFPPDAVLEGTGGEPIRVVSELDLARLVEQLEQRQ